MTSRYAVIALCLVIKAAPTAGESLPMELSQQDQARAVATEQPLCGAYCLYISLLALDVPIESLEVLQAKLGEPPKAGYSFARLAEAAESFGVHTRGVETTLTRLQSRPQRFACIAHLEHGHFVCIAAVSDNGVEICDPPSARTLPAVTFEHMWDGKALLLAREPLKHEAEIIVESGSYLGWWFVGGAVMAAVAAAFYLGVRARA